MIVLDADSIMSVESMVRLSCRLAAAPGVGLIQTLPTIVLANTLYGRLQQFANQCFGPIYAEGLSSWHGLSSHFWGYNAIIRTKAFAESCHLPSTDDKRNTGERLLGYGDQCAACRCHTLVRMAKCMMCKKLHFLLFPLFRLYGSCGRAGKHTGEFVLIRIWQSRCLRVARPFRPVTLRVHLSMNLPLSDSYYLSFSIKRSDNSVIRGIRITNPEKYPDRFIANMSKAKRKGKIFIDYLRNGRRSTIENIAARLSSLKEDPWKDFFKVRQWITDTMKKN